MAAKFSSEYLTYVIREWAENLNIANHAAKEGDVTSKDKLRDEVTQKMFGTEKLTKSQSFNEQSFTMYAYGLAFMPRVVANPLADNKLVNAWRKTVQRNRFQPKFDVLESLLKETLNGPGAPAAIAAFPKLKDATAADVIDSLRAIGAAPKLLDQYVVNDLIKQALPAAAPAPQQQPKP